MKTWQDTTGYTWGIKLTLELADRVLAATKVDLIPDDNDLREVVALVFQARKLGDVLWECSREEAAAQNISKEEFKKRIGGSALAAGWEVLVEEVKVFTAGQNPQLAPLLDEALEAHGRFVEDSIKVSIRTMTSDKANEIMKQAVEQIEQDMLAALADSVTNGAAS